ncbi:MAG: hypothetical protein R3D89_06715 [Sphingomonadaceae bacterium]|jgi:hypothetical protein
MAKFSADQVAAVLAMKQAIYEWGDELDLHNGESMTQRGCLTDDVEYFVGGEWRNGIGEVQEFYNGRIAAQREAGAIMRMRHFITNLKIDFVSETHAKVDFLLLFFAKAGEIPFNDYCDPLASADVWMECKQGADGEWRISKFNSTQVFIRG